MDAGPFPFPGDILAISPSNELAIVQGLLAVGGGTLARVPMSGGTPRPVVENVMYAGADFSPDGNELAVVRAVDGKTRLEYPVGKVLVSGDVGGPRISPDGRNLVFWEEVDGRGVVSIVARDGVKRALSGGWLPPGGGAACWSPDGREVWVPNQLSNDVTVIDAKRWSVVTTVKGEFAQPDGIGISGDGRLVFVANHNTTHVMNMGGIQMAMPASATTASPGRVIVIDARRREVVRRIDTAPDGAGLGIAGGQP